MNNREHLLINLQQIPSPEYFSIYKNQSEVFLNWQGGEKAALEHLKMRLEVEQEAFSKGTYLPNHANVDLLSPPTSMSTALRYGCLSVRRFFYAIHDKFNEIQKQLPYKLPSGHHITGQLIWREYFYTMSVQNPNYGQMKDNPICLNIPWKTPNDFDVQRWKQGQTGIPIIDASMRQLLVNSYEHS